jgi:hypothetical protein
MKTRRTSLPVALLPYLLGDDQALVGDLAEERPRRSNAWFWRQVVSAIFAKAMTSVSATLREPQRLGRSLGSAAVLLILSFQVVVAGSLLDDLIQRAGPVTIPRIDHPEWFVFVLLLSLPVAWLIGRAMCGLHRRSRAATILVVGTSAAAVGAVTISVLSAPGFSFFPSAAQQTAVALVFVLGLRIGGWSRSPFSRHA